jgi:RPA family protein
MLLSCKFFFETEKVSYFITHVDSVRVEKISGTTIEFKAFIGLATPCYTYSHYKAIRENNDYQIRLYSYLADSGPCPQVIVQEEVPVTIDVKEKGTYHFHFYSTDSLTVDLDVTI